MEERRKKGLKSSVIIISAVFVAVLIIVLTAVSLYYAGKNDRAEARSELLSELDARVGEYDESSIVLSRTSRTKAEKLAAQLGAKLRITADGRFATLTLPEGTTIRDVVNNDTEGEISGEITPDYSARIFETTETEGDNEKHTRLPVPANYTVSDTLYSMQTYLNYLNIGNAWQSYNGAGITVAVIDTGIDTDHPEFAGRISEYSYNASKDKTVKDYTLADGSYDWSLIEDEQGHGTSVAGTIGAAMDGQGTVGVAPGVTFLVIKAECTADGSFLRSSDLVFGLYYAIERDVSVINMSFGGPNNIYSEAALLAKDSDILCVAAAGNKSTSVRNYPAADENVIGVGALAGESWELADYSNYGENTDLVAPGTVYTSKLGGGYCTVSGTSLASPIVAAALALLKCDGNYRYSSNEVIEELLYASCYDLGAAGKDWYFGYGALDMNALLCEEKGRVTFNMMTDELENTEQVFVRGHVLQDIPEPERNYAVFNGWYYDIQCTEEYDLYADSFVADLTLYAGWVNEDDGVPYTYVVLDDGTVEIRSYTDKRRFITVPDMIEGREVSSIGDFAFSGQSRLREVNLPAKLKNIGLSAFDGCNNLLKITIPDGVATIGERAFADNTRLASVVFTESSVLKSIGDMAFLSCASLERIDLPVTLEAVNGSAFFGTSSMQRIDISAANAYFASENGVLFDRMKSTLIAYPAGLSADYTIPAAVSTIGDYAFGYTRVKNIDLAGVKRIGESAFACAGFGSVNIPDSVTAMGNAAFFGCSSLSEVRLGNGLTQISSGCFSYCSILSKIEIPSGILVIGGNAFVCSAMSEVTFADDSRLVAIGESAFAKCPLTKISLPASLTTIGSEAFSCDAALSEVDFGENSALTYIGSKAFAYTYSLGTVKLPSGLRAIGDYAFRDSGISGKVTLPAGLNELGGGAFAACRGLTSFEVESGNTVYKAVDGVVYTLSGKTLVEYPAGAPNTSYTVAEGTENIGNAAFYGSDNLTEVLLPVSLIDIGEYALSYCGNLSSMSIPDNVTRIGRYAFAGDMNLYTINIGDNTGLSRIGFAAFANCGVQYMRIPANVSSIAQYAFEGCENLTSVTFAANSRLESISAYFFRGCDSIQYITFEQGSRLTSIQAHGFEGMKRLVSVDFGDAGLTNIDNYAFRYCESLYSLNLPQGLSNIGRFAFYKCRNFSELSLPASLEHIGSYAFHGTNECNLYFANENLPLYLDENWDDDVGGYYTGVTEINTDGDYKYARLTDGSSAIIEYLGNEKNVDLTSVNIGKITNIGGAAFRYKDIESVKLPSTVTQIQRYAFADTKMLKEISIPAGVTLIARYAFSNTGLERLTFEGNGLRKAEQYAFAYNGSLKSVTLPSSLESLGSYAFYKSGLESLTFASGSTIAEIPQYAFAGTNIKSLTLPDSVTLVNNGAFRDNQSLRTLTLGGGKDLRLMSNAFYNTALEQVVIPANVEYIGEYSLIGLKNLGAYSVEEGNKYYKSVDGVLYNREGTKLIAFPAGRSGSFTVPASVETIGFGAFENSKLEKVDFADGINLLTLGYRAFYGAESLKEINIPKTVVSIDYYAFARCKNLETVTFEAGNRLTGIYEGAFYGCQNLKNIELPEGIREISDYAFFGCMSLKKLPFGEGNNIRGIYSYAFAYTGLEGEFTLPDGIADVGDYAFRGTRLREFTIPDANKKEILLGIGIVADCNKLESIDIPFAGSQYLDPDITWFGYIFGAGASSANETYVPKTLRYVRVGSVAEDERNGINSCSNVFGSCFRGSQALEEIILPEGLYDVMSSAFNGCTNLRTVMIPDSVTSIGAHAFEDCTDLTSINIPDGVTSIGSSAFWGCTGLTSISIPDGVTSIGSSAFSDCRGLTTIMIPDSVTSIGSSAFEGCTGLTTITIPDSVTSIGIYAFLGCTGLTTITIPDSVTSIGWSAFEGCTGLTTITIPDSVTSIDSYAFRDCAGLTSVTIPGSVTSIGGSAFSGCKGLTAVHITDIEKWCNISFGASDANPLYYAHNLYLNGTLVTNLVIPDSVTSIGDYAFYECTGLYIIKNNSTLKLTIGSGDNGKVAYYARMIINADGSVTYKDDGNTYILTDDKFLFEKNNDNYRLIAYTGDLETVTLPKDINGSSYDIYHMRGVRNVIIPEGFTSIGESAFGWCEGLTSITIPDSVTSIGENAFKGCTGLTSITIPDSVTSIGGGAFEGCTGLTSITIPDSVTSIGSVAFRGCTGLTSITIGNGVTSIYHYAFKGTALYDDPDNWKDGCLLIGNNLIICDDTAEYLDLSDVKVIAAGALNDAKRLKQVTIGGDHYGALSQLTNLETLIITEMPTSGDVSSYFGGSIPITLKTVVIRSGCDISSSYSFGRISDVTIYVEDEKIDCPWDHDVSGWNNDNKVYYGGEWYHMIFHDADGTVLLNEYYRSHQIVRPPFVDSTVIADVSKTFLGWDFDGDGTPDSMPATFVGEIEATAVYEITEAKYSVRFIGKDGEVLESFSLPYGAVVPAPATPSLRGYTFGGWEGYTAGMTVSGNVDITSVWTHDGEGHDYVKSYVAPTCTDDGYTLHTCRICGESYKTDTIAAAGHSFGDWITDVEATCTNAGKHHRDCACGFTEGESIPAHGHSYTVTVTREATCMRNGEMLCECSVCHESRTESIPALEHTYVKKYAQRSWLEWLVEHLLNVFFGYEGNLGFYYECEDCHRIMTFEEGTRLNSVGAQSTACVHDHGDWTEEKAPGCTDGVSVRKCTKCGKTLEARTVAAKDPDAHDFGEWTQTKAPTYTEKGEEKRTCKNCEHFEVREIAEKAYIPGDLNGDGVVNMQDVVLLRQYIVGGYEVEINILAADVNGDGKINMQDVVLMRQYIVGGYDVVLK